MDNVVILKLAEDNPLSDIDRLVNIYHLLSQVLVFHVPGDIVELGCHQGKTSVFLRMLIDHYDAERELHVYDSFSGLPKQGKYDTYLMDDNCMASIQQLQETFTRWHVELPIIHKGWFQETLPQLLPERIAFAYLDGDFYDSILVSLRYVYPRLTNNAVVIIDDYCDPGRNPNAWDGPPGPKKACDDFFQTNQKKL